MSQTEHELLQINKLDSTTTNYSTNDADLDEARKQSAFHCRVFPGACTCTHGKVYMLLTFTNELTNGIKG